MLRSSRRLIRSLLAVVPAGLLVACAAHGPKEPPPDVVLPRTFSTLPDLVPQIQAIVQGTVEDVRFDYDACEGPRTIVRLVGIETLLGDRHPSTLELRTFGGPLPDGDFMEASELPRYVLGARYLLVLRNTDWRFSPVIGDLALRHESIAGKEVLVNTQGFAVTGLDANGVKTSKVAVTAPAGQRVIGAKASPEYVKELLATPRPAAGQHAPCDATRSAACGPGTSDAGVQRARELLIASGRFARPAVLPGSRESVAESIAARDLVAAIDRWAREHTVRLGGYYAERPRIGCWEKTSTERPRG